MTKALPPASNPASAFPWGIIVQVLILVVEVIEEATRKRK